LSVTIRVDVRHAIRQLDDLAKKQLPFAIAQAVNDLAVQVAQAENAAMTDVFKKPGRWTRTATRALKTARKGSPVARVVVLPGRDYLTPYEIGGVHVLPPTKAPSGGTLFNPKAVRLNANLQIRKGTIAGLLTRPDVFVGKVHGVRGIWQRLPPGRAGKRALPNGLVRQQVRLLIRFGDALPVKQHLDFHTRAAMVVAQRAPMAFQRALAKALATAKS
jgi:hypothetical protein